METILILKHGFGFSAEEMALIATTFVKHLGKTLQLGKCYDRIKPRILANYHRIRDVKVDWTAEPMVQLRSPYLRKSSAAVMAVRAPQDWSPQDWYGQWVQEAKCAVAIPAAVPAVSEPQFCGICTEPVEMQSGNITRLACGHMYHLEKAKGCDGVMKWWLNYKSSCPTCREELNATKVPDKYVTLDELH